MSIVLFLSCVTAFIMLMWFKTDAVVEWVGLFGLKKMSRNFKDARIQVAPEFLTYPQYLRKKYNCFLTRLLVCPFCTCVWLVAIQCVGLSILFSNIQFIVIFPIVYFISLFIYGITVKLYNTAP